jgi:glycogen synthase
MHMLMQNAMKQDFSWDRSVREYLQLYETAIHMKKEYDARFV